MKSPYEIEHERIVFGFIMSFIILVIIALVFHKELISYLTYIVTKLDSLAQLVKQWIRNPLS